MSKSQFRLLIFLYINLLLGSQICFWEQAFGQNNNSMDVGYSSSFIVDHNRSDIVSASNVLVSMIKENYQLETDHTIKIYDSKDEIIRDLLAKKLDAIGIPVIEYLEIKNENLLEPVVIAEINNQTFEKYLLLVHTKSGFESLVDLENKRIIIGSSHMGSIAKTWLDVLLLQAELMPVENYFDNVKHISKTSKVVIPLFLSQIDACVISESSFNTMAALNPQIGEQLKILKTSPEFANNVYCMRMGLGEDENRTKILNSLIDMANNTAGRQLLRLFRINKLNPVESAAFDNTINVVNMKKNLGQKGGRN
jgi:ABC-type phosphate/phosphonate transport system substrate-binding protein